MSDQRLKIAVFIDFDNIEIGVKTTLGLSFDIGAVLEAIKERGEIITKVAYGDWKRAGDYGRAMSQPRRPPRAARDDPRRRQERRRHQPRARRARDGLHPRPHQRLRHRRRRQRLHHPGREAEAVRQEGVRRRRPRVHQPGDAEELHRVHRLRERRRHRRAARSRRSRAAGAGRASARPCTSTSVRCRSCKRALKVLADREVSPQLGLLKSTLLQLDSSFSERDYGASTFRDFAEKLAEKGSCTLKHTGRTTLVELSEAGAAMADRGRCRRPPSGVRQRRRRRHRRRVAAPAPRAPREVDPATAEALAEGVALVRNVLADPPQPPRWPMYLRQIKQFIRRHPTSRRPTSTTASTARSST